MRQTIFYLVFNQLDFNLDKFGMLQNNKKKIKCAMNDNKNCPVRNNAWRNYVCWVEILFVVPTDRINCHFKKITFILIFTKWASLCLLVLNVFLIKNDLIGNWTIFPLLILQIKWLFNASSCSIYFLLLLLLSFISLLSTNGITMQNELVSNSAKNITIYVYFGSQAVNAFISYRLPFVLFICI